MTQHNEASAQGPPSSPWVQIPGDQDPDTLVALHYNKDRIARQKKGAVKMRIYCAIIGVGFIAFGILILSWDADVQYFGIIPPWLLGVGMFALALICLLTIIFGDDGRALEKEAAKGRPVINISERDGITISEEDVTFGWHEISGMEAEMGEHRGYGNIISNTVDRKIAQETGLRDGKRRLKLHLRDVESVEQRLKMLQKAMIDKPADGGSATYEIILEHQTDPEDFIALVDRMAHIFNQKDLRLF